jgi:hypothetical protein
MSKWIIALIMACAGPAAHAATAAEPPAKAAKAAEGKPAAAAQPASMKEAFGSAVEISAEVKLIDKRLQSLEQSVASISNSLEPVGKLTRPEGLHALLVEAGDLAYERARSLIFLATGCAAALILGMAALWHWVVPARKS